MDKEMCEKINYFNDLPEDINVLDHDLFVIISLIINFIIIYGLYKLILLIVNIFQYLKNKQVKRKPLTDANGSTEHSFHPEPMDIFKLYPLELNDKNIEQSISNNKKQIHRNEIIDSHDHDTGSTKKFGILKLESKKTEPAPKGSKTTTTSVSS